MQAGFFFMSPCSEHMPVQVGNPSAKGCGIQGSVEKVLF